jgi:hypothetical protein
MAKVLRPRRVLLNHHDDWLPPVTFHLDEGQFAEPLAEAGTQIDIVGMGQTLELAR